MATSMRLKLLVNATRFARLSVATTAKTVRPIHYLRSSKSINASAGTILAICHLE